MILLRNNVMCKHDIFEALSSENDVRMADLCVTI